MPIKSIQLSDDEATELDQYASASGESESEALKRAALHGLRTLRLERAIEAFRNGLSSSEACEIAGLPRAIFLQMLIDRDVVILDDPSTFLSEVEHLAEYLGSERLAAAARKVAAEGM